MCHIQPSHCVCHRLIRTYVLTGFGYDFNSIAEGETNELVKSFNEVLAPGPMVSSENPIRVFINAKSAISTLNLESFPDHECIFPDPQETGENHG